MRKDFFFFGIFGVCIETLFDYANLSRLELAFPALNMLNMSAWDGVKSLSPISWLQLMYAAPTIT